MIHYETFPFVLKSNTICADQIGLTPEEVISKIMANPDVAMAFQNPRVQQAIMEVSSCGLCSCSILIT